MPSSETMAYLRMVFHTLIVNNKNEQAYKCAAEFARIAESRGVTAPMRVAVMQTDGGCFRKDFERMEDAVRCFNANARYGSPLLVVAFNWTEKLGWQELARYPQH